MVTITDIPTKLSDDLLQILRTTTSVETITYTRTNIQTQRDALVARYKLDLAELDSILAQCDQVGIITPQEKQ